MSKQFKTIIAEAERAQVGAVEKSKKDLEEANAFAIAAKEELEVAEELVEKIEHHFTAGADTFSPADWTEAKAKHRRAALRVKGSAGKIRKAERGIVNGDKSLASAVASVLRPRVGEGVTVEATFAKGFFDRPSDRELPLLLVTQTEPTVVLGNGCISGKVTITYYRTPLHTPFDVSEFPSWALSKVGAHFRFGNARSENDTQDTLDLTVHSVASPNPVIPEIKALHLQTVGGHIVNHLLLGTRGRDEAIRTELPSRVMLTNKLKARTNPHLIVEEKVENGERTLVLDVPIIWQQRVAKLEHVNVRELLAEGVTNEAGTFLDNIGWVESAEIVTKESDLWDHSEAAERKWRTALETNERDFSAKSGGFGFPDCVIVRYVIKSRVS